MVAVPTEKASDETDAEGGSGPSIGRIALAVLGVVAVVALVFACISAGPADDDSDEAL